MLHLFTQHVFLFQKFTGLLLQALLFAFDDAPFGDVFDAKQYGGTISFVKTHFAYMQQEVSQTNSWEFVRERKSFYDIWLREHSPEQLAQLRNVPGPVVQCKNCTLKSLTGCD